MYYAKFATMSILVVAATAPELQGFKSAGAQPDVLITGVGTIAVSYHLTRQIRLKEYKLVIQAGLAGAFDSNTPLGEVVSVRSDRFADRLIREKGVTRPLDHTGLIGGDVFPFWEGRLVNPNPLIASLPYRQVAGATVDSLTDEPAMISEYRQLFSPDVESMEGAAFHYVCLMEDVPFLQLRAVSNYVGERDKSKWQTELAIRNLGEALNNLVVFPR